MTKNETIELSEYIDNALFKLGKYSEVKNPEYAKMLVKTNIFLRQQLKKLETTCKDCGYILHKEDYREVMDDGVTLCEDCIIKAERAAYEDSVMKESARN